MLKAVNMKGYRFGARANGWYNGFGILDTSTNTFVSLCGRHPWTFDRNKDAQKMIGEPWITGVNRVAFTAS